MNRLFDRGLTNSEMQGVYIASSPQPVPQVELMRELRRVVGMPVGIPAFSWMVRIAAPWLLRTDPDLALYGRYAIPKRLEKEGFEFQQPQISGALREILNGDKS